MDVMVVGANSGLGLALCGAYARAGHRVFGGALLARPHEALAALPAEGLPVTLVDMDVTRDDAVRAAAGQVQRTCGGLDVLVYCAGLLCDSDRTQPVYELSVGDFQDALEVNVTGMARVVKAFHPSMRRDGWFVAVTSEGGSLQNIGTAYPAYSVTKAAANKLAATLAASTPGYRVYALHPGRMDTEMGREFAQIQPEESAAGILAITSGEVVPPKGVWFIDYRGRAMEV